MARTDARGGPQTRERIREVANTLFMERGFDAVTVAEVAREAGVSTVTLFNHFATKEDLFLDRSDDAIEFLRSAIGAGGDPVASLRGATMRLVDERGPLSGIDPRSMPFYRTVANSPALLARARAIASELQRVLSDELAGRQNGRLLAAFFIAGYSSVLVETAGRLIAGESADDLVDDHRARFERMFEALRNGV